MQTMCCSLFYLPPYSYTSMSCIRKTASLSQTDIFPNINKCSSYNTINSFPHMIFPPIPILFKAKSKAPRQKKKHKVTEIYGSWFKSMRRNAVWSKQSRGDDEGMEQKVTHKREGKADGPQDFFLEGRHSAPPSPTAASMSQFSTSPQRSPGTWAKYPLSLRLRPHLQN